jgi:hypothetical protein
MPIGGTNAMPALYPHAARPEDFKIGDQVKWFISESAVSPYVGRVYAINPKTVKVWVTWPIGGNTQHGPEELILVPPEQGLSVITQPAPGGSNWEVQKSERIFGKLTPANVVAPSEMKKMASSIVSSEMAESAVRLASAMASDGMHELIAHDRMTTVYGGILPPDAIKSALQQAYYAAP